MADLTRAEMIDLAFRYRHGWIKLGPDEPKVKGLKGWSETEAKIKVTDLEAAVERRGPTTTAKHTADMTKILGRAPREDELHGSLKRLREQGLLAPDTADDRYNAEVLRLKNVDTSDPYKAMRGMEDRMRGGKPAPKGSPYAAMRAQEAKWRGDTPATKQTAQTVRSRIAAWLKSDGTDWDSNQSTAAKLRRGALGTQSEFDAGAAAARARKVNMTTAQADAAEAARLKANSPTEKALHGYNEARRRHGENSRQAKRAKAKMVKAYANFRKDAASLSTPVKDSDIDLDWSAYNSGRKRAPRPPHPAGFHSNNPVKPKVVKAFRKSTGVKSLGSAHGQAVLAKRASSPGHFRAKAILAAQTGNMGAARKFAAKSAAAHKARVGTARVVKPAAARPPAAHFAAPKPAAAPKPFKPPKPKGPRRTR